MTSESSPASSAPGGPQVSSPLPRWRRGLSSAAGLALLPLRKLMRLDVSDLDTPQRRQTGLIVVLPGIEGRSLFNVGLARGLDEGGCRQAIQLHDWTSRRLLASLSHLRDVQRNRQQGRLLAERIVDYRRQHPQGEVHLVGHSGGAGMALFALEALPDDVVIHSAALLAAAVSARYDLTAALRHTRRIINFHSPWDVLHLVLGTTVFGTLDRQFVVSAGARSFVAPPHADPQLYAERLSQVRFRSAMIRHWHLGGHLGWTNRVFAAEQLAPLLLGRDEGKA